MKTYLIVFALLILVFSCKEKKSTDDLKVNVAPQDTIVAATPIVEEPVVKIDEGVHLEDKYFLVINSYTVEEFAEAANKQYQNKGFNSAVFMRDQDGYYRLALKSFNDFEQAKKAMEELKQDEEFKNLWIVVK